MKKLLRALALGVLAITIAAPALHSQLSREQKRAVKAAHKSEKKQRKAQKKAAKQFRKRAQGKTYTF